MAIKSIDTLDVAKITSGQVIIDLVSVVKELVENSIDAGSDKIDVTFSNYGIASVEVSDNGGGIEPADFDSLCLKHHTSKLSTFEDLTSVNTLGFRGEAMSSLCSVSKVKVTTCTQSSFPKATELHFDHMGKLTSKKTVVLGKKGTTVTVSDIFHSMPVRQKNFVKNGKKEYSRTLALLMAYLLAYTNVRFTVFNVSGSTGKKTMAMGTQGGRTTTSDALVSIFGSNGAYGLVPIDIQSGNIDARFKLNMTSVPVALSIRVLGYISDSSFGLGRGSGDRQYLTINKRPVTHKRFVKVINEVYKTFNTTQSPVFVLDMVLDTAFVDVNVTPDKRLVLMQSEDVICEVLREELTAFYEHKHNVVPKSQLGAVSMGGLQSRESQSQPKRAKLLRFSQMEEEEKEVEQQHLEKVNEEEEGEEKEEEDEEEQEEEEQEEEEQEEEVEDEDDEEVEEQHLSSESEPHNAEVEEIERNQEPQVTTITVSDAGIGHSLAHSLGPVDSGREITDLQEAKSADMEPVRNNTHSDYSGSHNDSATKNSQSIAEPRYAALDSSDLVKHNGLFSLQEDTEMTETDEVAAMESECEVGGETLSQRNEIVDDFQDLQDDDQLFVDELSQRENDGHPQSETCLQSESGNSSPRHHDCSGPKEPHEAANNFHQTARPGPNSVPLDATTTSSTDQLHRVQVRLQLPSSFASQQLAAVGDGSDLQKSARVRAALHDLAQTLEIRKADFAHMAVVGQFNLGFIVVIHEGKLFIVDQHALDEIYNYERLMGTLVLRAQPLVAPRTLELSAIDEMTILEHLPQLRSNGFIVEEDEDAAPGQRAKLVAVPVLKNVVFDDSDLHELVHKLHLHGAAKFAENHKIRRTVRCTKVDAMIALRACRLSIMVGQALNKPTMETVVKHLATLDRPWNCPHGRPTMRHLADLEGTSFGDDYDL